MDEYAEARALAVLEKAVDNCLACHEAVTLWCEPHKAQREELEAEGRKT